MNKISTVEEEGETVAIYIQSHSLSIGIVTFTKKHVLMHA